MNIYSRRTIDRLSKLHTICFKTQEVFLYLTSTLVLLGIENSRIDLVALTCPAFSNTIVGLICFAAETMMEAEEKIRDAYYDLNWERAPIESRKMIILAMYPPKKITFCGVFSYDHASLERFTIVFRRAYDFGLVMLKLFKK